LWETADLCTPPFWGREAETGYPSDR